MADFGTLRAEHNGVALECQAVAPGLSIHDLVMAFEDAKAQAKPGDEFSGNPSQWPEVRGVTAVVDAVTKSMLAREGAAVAAAKAQIVGWLRFQEREWRDTSANLGSSVAGNVAAHYAQALHNAIESIESDAPERWAAEREDERG